MAVPFDVGFDGSVFPLELNCFNPSFFQTNLISGRIVGRQQQITALIGQHCIRRDFQGKRLPVDLHAGPNHQVGSSPSWVSQINCDDLGEADDGDETSTSFMSRAISIWGRGTHKLPKTNMIAIKILWYKGTFKAQIYGRGTIIRPMSVMIPPIATPT